MIAYASGSLATGILNAVPTILLLFFATEIVGIQPATAAPIVLLPKLWIIFWDPFVGTRSDRTRSRWGRRIPFLVAGAMVCLLSFVALFRPPALGYGAMVAWVSATYFILMCGYSLFAVPYMAVPTEITQDDRERSNLVRWRMSLAMVGALIGAAGAPAIVQGGGGGRAGYGLMAVVIGAVCCSGMLAPVAMIQARNRTRIDAMATVPTGAMMGHVARAWHHRHFRSLVLTQVLQVTAIGALSAAIPYLVTRGMVRPQGDVGTVLLAYLLPSIPAIPFWGWVGKRGGDGTAQSLAALVYAAGSILIGLSVVYHVPWPIALLPALLLGVGFGGMQGQSFTIAARLIHHDSGDATQATHTGVWTAGERLGLAIGPAMTAVALASWGGDLAIWTACASPILMLASLPFLLDATREGHTG